MQNITHQASLKRAISGDHITVKIAGRTQGVLLHGISTPEHGKPGHQEARKALRKMLGGRHFSIEELHRDSGWRISGIVYQKDLLDSINLRMVQEGYAYAEAGLDRNELGLIKAQEEARQQKLGVWMDPWNYRPPGTTAREIRNGALMAAATLLALTLLIAVIAVIA